VSHFAPTAVCRSCHVYDPDPDNILYVTASSHNNKTKKEKRMGYKRLRGAR